MTPISMILRGDLTLHSTYSVIKAFAGLVIFRAIAGNITSYSCEIFGHLNSLLKHGLFPAIAGNCSSFVFPAIAGISQVQPGTSPRLKLRLVPGAT